MGLHHPLTHVPLRLCVLVGRVQIPHLDLCKVVSSGSRFLAGHERLQVLDDLSCANVDTLKDVHLGGDWALGWRMTDDVDQDVVVHLLGVGAREGRGLADKAEGEAFNNFLKIIFTSNVGYFKGVYNTFNNVFN